VLLVVVHICHSVCDEHSWMSLVTTTSHPRTSIIHWYQLTWSVLRSTRPATG